MGSGSRGEVPIRESSSSPSVGFTTFHLRVSLCQQFAIKQLCTLLCFCWGGGVAFVTTFSHRLNNTIAVQSGSLWKKWGSNFSIQQEECVACAAM